MKPVLLPLVLLLVGAVACSDSTGSPPTELDEALDQAVDELQAMPGGPPAVVVVVQRASDRTLHTAGVVEVGTDVEPTVDDHMRIASVAKAFSGATALSLVDEGVLSLDDTIAQRLPDLPAAWGEVTLRQLLNHTSGVPDFILREAFGEAVVASLDEAPPPAELLAFVADEPLDFPPGTRYVYSNSDNIVVALMIEAATGSTYADVLTEEVLDPLGLDDTSLPTGVEMPEPFLHGYDLDPPNPPEDDSNQSAAGWAWASGGIVSTPADLNDFIRGYVGGELFDDDVRGEQQDVFIPAGGSEPPGPGLNSATMALFRYQTECGTVYGHTGNTFRLHPVRRRLARRSALGDGVDHPPTHAESEDQAAAVFDALQRVEQAAICMALD